MINGIKCCSFGEGLISCPEEIRDGITEKMEFEEDIEGS